MYDMRTVAPTVCSLLGIRVPASADSEPHPSVIDTIGETTKICVVVIDALGMSTWKGAKKRTPTLNRLESVHGSVIHSVMTSITPVNFATMLTGASPETHGITNREMPLRHETVFHVMREIGLRSATAARAQSSLGILISPHSDKPGLAESNTDAEVTEIAVSRLFDGYNLVWVHLLDVDDAGHKFGPSSRESMDAVSRADGNLRRILETARDNDYSVIVLADHGQHDTDEGGYKGTHGTDMSQDIEVPFLWASNDELQDIL